MEKCKYKSLSENFKSLNMSNNIKEDNPHTAIKCVVVGENAVGKSLLIVQSKNTDPIPVVVDKLHKPIINVTCNGTTPKISLVEKLGLDFFLREDTPSSLYPEIPPHQLLHPTLVPIPEGQEFAELNEEIHDEFSEGELPHLEMNHTWFNSPYEQKTFPFKRYDQKSIIPTSPPSVTVSIIKKSSRHPTTSLNGGVCMCEGFCCCPGSPSSLIPAVEEHQFYSDYCNCDYCEKHN